MAVKGRKPVMRRPFAEIKRDLVNLVAPHLADPERNGLRKLSYEEISILLAEDKASAASRSSYCEIEKTALAKLRPAFEKLGVRSVSDMLGSPRESDEFRLPAGFGGL